MSQFVLVPHKKNSICPEFLANGCERLPAPGYQKLTCCEFELSIDAFSELLKDSDISALSESAIATVDNILKLENQKSLGWFRFDITVFLQMLNELEPFIRQHLGYHLESLEKLNHAALARLLRLQKWLKDHQFCSKEIFLDFYSNTSGYR